MNDTQSTQNTLKRLAENLAASAAERIPSPGFFKPSDLLDEDLAKAMQILTDAGIEVSNSPSNLRISNIQAANPEMAQAVVEFSDFTHQIFKLVPGFMASLSVKEFVDSYEKIRKEFAAAHSSVLVASGAKPKPKSTNRFLAALTPDAFTSEAESRDMMTATAEKVPEIEASSMSVLKKFSVYFDQVSALVLAEHHVIAAGERILARVDGFAPTTQDGKAEKDLLVQTLIGMQASASAAAHTSMPLIDSLSAVNHSAIAFLSQQSELLDRCTKNHAARQDIRRAQDALEALMAAAVSADSVLKKTSFKTVTLSGLVIDQVFGLESALGSSSSSYADKINSLLSNRPIITPEPPPTTPEPPIVAPLPRLSDVADPVPAVPPTQLDLARQKRIQRVFVEKMGFQPEAAGFKSADMIAFAPTLLSDSRDAVNLLCQLLGGQHVAALPSKPTGPTVDWPETERAIRLLNLAADLCALESRPQLESEAPASVERLKKDISALSNNPRDLDLASKLFIGPILMRAACLHDFGAEWVSACWRSMPLSGLPLDQWGGDFRDVLSSLPRNATTAAAIEKSTILPKECLDGFFDRLSVQAETFWFLPDSDQGYLRPQPFTKDASSYTEVTTIRPGAEVDPEDATRMPASIPASIPSPAQTVIAARTMRAPKTKSQMTESTGPR